MRRWITVLCAALAIGAATSAAANAVDLDSKPALRGMLDEFRSQLDLTDEQAKEARGLIEGEIGRAETVVDELDDFTFDSVLDLLVEARAIRDDFLPQLRGLLTEEQKAKLDDLPDSDEIYIQGTVAWIADERVEKLQKRLNLSDEQIPRVREIVTEQVRDSVEIIEGVEDQGGGKRQDTLDAMMDLRGAQRRADRELGQVLDDEQMTQLEQMREKKRR